MQRINGVIFDMDGVLCDSERFIRDAAMEMMRRDYSLSVKPDDFLPFIGAGESRFISGVAEKYGVKLTLPRDKMRTYQIYLELIKGSLQPLDGVLEFIGECRRRGVRLAVASSADMVKVTGNLTEIGLPMATFDAVITGDDVTRHKPDPECFLKAAEALRLSPSACMVVEDANNGVKAAKAAGAHCLGLTTSFTPKNLKTSGADWTAPTLAEVPQEVMAILGGEKTNETLPSDPLCSYH
ncbi:MAG TPA: HAD-IA family hydrolase [Phycisphaerae bacterium]|nr:HAD-IA family hydrolase [Phycisphaerae bacterium]